MNKTNISHPNDGEGSTRRASLRSTRTAAIEAEKQDETKKKYREKTRLRVKAWRNRQKEENLEKHLDLKKTDKDRKSKERTKLKQMASSDPELKASLRRKKAEEMKRYRERKKQKAITSETSKRVETKSPVSKKSKVASLLRKRDAVKRTQEWRMRIKLKEKQTDIESDESESHEESKQSGKDLSRAAVYRHVQKVKDILPNTPRKKADILKKLIESPSTSKALSTKGVAMTRACKKKLQVADVLIDSVKESISEVKGSDHKDRDKKHAFGVISGSILRKYGKLRLGKYFNVSCKKRKMQAEWWKKKQRKTRNDTIGDKVKDSVRNFFLSAEISREVPSKREVVRVKTPSGKKETLQKHMMTMTLEEAHKLYKSRYPDHKIGLTSFNKLKPVNVKKVSETSRRSCLCQICCNIALKVEALTTMKRAAKEKGITEDININKKSLSDATFCSYQNEPSVKCVTRNCTACGVENLKNFLQPLDTTSDDVVSWYHWETIEINKDEKVKRCVSCVPKETDFKTFMAALEKDMIIYPEHAFRASWQQKQMGTCIDKLSEGSASIVMDFSENYSCVFQSEVQSGFFDRNQVTVHPMMCYYKEKVEEKDVLVKHAIIGISEENKHDADLAFAFENQALKTLESRGVNIEVVHEWTDGCAAQYKGKKSFADISLRKKPSVVRNYFETSHGKNVCDGLGATVKNACYRAVVSNKKVIGNANDVFQFCQDNLTLETVIKDQNTVSRREFVFINHDQVKRNRQETDVKTLTGTRKLHSVMSVNKDYELCTRNLSCYCDACVQGRDSECENSEIVSRWEKRKLDIVSAGKPKEIESEQHKQQTTESQSEVQKHQETSKRKRESIKTRTTKKRRGAETPVSTSQKSTNVKYKSGNFVAVGLKPKKGPISVYIAEIMQVYKDECCLKYMKKSGSVYTWPENPDMSQELKDSIVSFVESPKLVNERGHFKFRKDELESIKEELMKKHKHVCFK